MPTNLPLTIAPSFIREIFLVKHGSHHPWKRLEADFIQKCWTRFGKLLGVGETTGRVQMGSHLVKTEFHV